MRLVDKSVKHWIEQPVCIGYSGGHVSIYEGVALFTDDTMSKAWTIQASRGDGCEEMSPEVYLDCPDIDIWNTPKS